MSSDKTYNGWSGGYATWRINMELCDDIIEGLDGTTFDSLSDLAKYLEDEVDEILTQYGEITSGVTLDYARAFVSDVDFYEIAEHHAEDNDLINSDDDDTDDDTEETL